MHVPQTTLDTSVIVKCAERALSRHTTDPTTAGDVALSFASLLGLELCNQDSDTAALLLDVIDASSAITPQEEQLQLLLQCLGLLVNKARNYTTMESRAMTIAMNLPGLLSQLAPDLANQMSEVLGSPTTAKVPQ